MPTKTGARRTNGTANKLLPEDRPAHEWYRFVLGYPPHLVREYVGEFDVPANGCVLDPFCGTGTTPVECKKLGLAAVGVEANPLAAFASEVKCDWSPDPDGLLAHAREVADAADARLRAQGIVDEPFLSEPTQPRADLLALSPEQDKLLLKDSISPLPLHKTLVLLQELEARRDPLYDRHERLALAKGLVNGISNLAFGPEVGVGERKPDAPVLGTWLAGVEAMVQDLRALQDGPEAPAIIYRGDAREVPSELAAASVDAVITSPPYPNEKDYTRTTRLESVLLGFINDRAELRAMKQALLRSNTRGVYKQDTDDRLVAGNAEVQRIAQAIETRRVELGKTSGFERQYHRVTKLYFGGMARHFASLRRVLKPGARLAYVVGDQASYLRVMIRTGQLLADIAASLGYEVEELRLFRTRLATATREQLREEVVILRWPGK